MRAHCQKWHRDYELRWKRRCHSDPRVHKKEDQFQEPSLRKESLFCLHLTEVHFKLPRPSAGFDSMWESFGRRIRFVQFSVICKHIMRDRVVTNYVSERLSIQNEENWPQDGTLNDSTSQKWGRGFFFFIHSYYLYLAGRNGWRRGQNHEYQKCYRGESEECYDRLCRRQRLDPEESE